MPMKFYRTTMKSLHNTIGFMITITSHGVKGCFVSGVSRVVLMTERIATVPYLTYSYGVLCRADGSQPNAIFQGIINGLTLSLLCSLLSLPPSPLYECVHQLSAYSYIVYNKCISLFYYRRTA